MKLETQPDRDSLVETCFLEDEETGEYTRSDAWSALGDILEVGYDHTQTPSLLQAAVFEAWNTSIRSVPDSEPGWAAVEDAFDRYTWGLDIWNGEQFFGLYLHEEPANSAARRALTDISDLVSEFDSFVEGFDHDDHGDPTDDTGEHVCRFEDNSRPWEILNRLVTTAEAVVAAFQGPVLDDALVAVDQLALALRGGEDA
jgi:hypothetical protein